jgi:Flp pilus assembly protein TadG
MTMISIKTLARDTRGVSLIEFALSLPLVAMLGLGGLEYTNFVLANQKLERISTITADAIARNTVAPSEKSFYDTFKAVDKAAVPFNITAYGRTILTGVIGVNKNGTIVNKVVWQRCGGQLVSATSSIGGEWTQTADFGEGPDVTLPNNVVLQQNQMVVVSEAFYKYEPMISVKQLVGAAPDGIIRQRSMFVTRGQAIPNITPIAGITPARCT